MRTILLAGLLGLLGLLALHGLPELAAFLSDPGDRSSAPSRAILETTGVLVVLAAFFGARLAGTTRLPAAVAATFVLCHPALARCLAAQNVAQLAILIIAAATFCSLSRRPMLGTLAVLLLGSFWLVTLPLSTSASYLIEPNVLRSAAAAADVYWPSGTLPFVEAHAATRALALSGAVVIVLIAVALIVRAWLAVWWLLLGPVIAATLTLTASRLHPELAVPPSTIVFGVLIAAQGLAGLTAQAGDHSLRRRLALVPVIAELVIALSAMWNWRQETSDPKRWIVAHIDDLAAEPAVVLRWSTVVDEADQRPESSTESRLRALLPASTERVRERALLRLCAIERAQGQAANARQAIDAYYPDPSQRPPRVVSEWLTCLGLVDVPAFRAALRDLDPARAAAEVCAAAGSGLLLLDAQGKDPAATSDGLLWLERALGKDAELYDARVALGTAQLRRGRLVDAVRTLEAAQKADPSRAEAFIELARLYFMQGELEGGEQQLSRAFAIDHRSPTATFLLGRVLFDATNNKDKGLRLMKAAIERDPTIPDGRRTLASCYLALAQLELAQGFQDRARTRAEQALHEQPGFAAANYLVGKLWAAGGDLNQAERYLGEAYVKEPELGDLARDLGDVLKRIGYRLFLSGDHPSAKPYFERILAMKPPGIKLGAIEALLRGDAPEAADSQGEEASAEREREQRKREARESYEQAMQLIAGGDDVAGETQLRASLAALPANPYAHFELGKLLTRRNESALALVELRESYALMRELRLAIPGVYVKLADALLTAGQKEEARVILSLYLERFSDGEDRAQAEHLFEQVK